MFQGAMPESDKTNDYMLAMHTIIIGQQGKELEVEQMGNRTGMYILLIAT